MKMLVFSFIILMACSYIYSAPIFDDFDDLFKFEIPDISATCKEFGCPANTTACSKHTRTTDDKKNILTEVKCYDSQGNLSASKTNTEQNPDPQSIKNNYVFHGSFTERSPIATANVNKEVDTKVDSAVETFEK